MVRIESDGTVNGTKIFNDKGDELEGIERVGFAHRGGKGPQVELTLGSVQGKFAGKESFYVCDPSDGDLKEVSKIEFADGSKFVPK